MGLFQNLTGWHAIIILAAILLLFGATRLPALARSVGQSMNIVKSELRDDAGRPSASSTVPAGAADAGEQRQPTTSSPVSITPSPVPTAAATELAAAGPAAGRSAEPAIEPAAPISPPLASTSAAGTVAPAATLVQLRRVNSAGRSVD